MRRALTAVGALALAAQAFGAAAGPLSEPAQRGRQIYVTGTSVAGRPIRAIIGGGAATVPASAVPCAGCHGRDGRGRPEAGLAPATITWAELTKPYGHAHADGRRHPPYTAAALARTIREAVDPAGQRLDPAKPVFAIADEDLDDLLAYLQVLGPPHDAGVGDGRLVVGAALPSTGPLADAAASVRAALQAVFDDVNGRGGVYDRRIELRVTERVEDAEVFAWVAPLIAGREAEAAAVVERHGVPVVGPFTLFPPTGAAERYLFLVLAGAADQARALVDFAAAGGSPPRRLTVVHPAGDALAGVAAAAAAQARRHGWSAHVVGYVPGGPDTGLAAQVAGEGAEAMLFLGDGREASRLLAALHARGAVPDVLLPAPLLGVERVTLPSGFRARLLLAYPPGERALSPAGAVAYAALSARHGLPARHPALQLAAVWSATVFLEALKRAGRDVSREALVAALEDLRDFDAGLAPLVTFGPNRRAGALGAYVVEVVPGGPPRPAAWVTPAD